MAISGPSSCVMRGRAAVPQPAAFYESPLSVKNYCRAILRMQPQPASRSTPHDGGGQRHNLVDVDLGDIMPA
jgi:hypothetical protein